MDLQQTQGSNVSGVDGNVRPSCRYSSEGEKKKKMSHKRKMTVGNNKSVQGTSSLRHH
jgi:hypothetical protein